LPLPDAEKTLAALVERMRGAIAFDAKFVGIYSGGAWMAERLAQAIPGDHPVGSSTYRSIATISAARG
jgi:pyrimidine operon attenuation protein/uracil phosphoribosyltransferase